MSPLSTVVGKYDVCTKLLFGKVVQECRVIRILSAATASKSPFWKSSLCSRTLRRCSPHQIATLSPPDRHKQQKSR
ncbi:hypothetical protein SJAG_05632 [Schizosaccharomyces japonicus yFS275]|uniref:Uncharacterized protein n=1 Tax=Schizosaccharomyces japonicus (strain yFS275 / FY16936) TaxID=402676 RepID=T0S2Z2_SCHJY|nr:hypothetical protein SJAG_05632 [Schizosaccharomyces japonicus yFS275]EQC52981.1 hypothetical protein SJAG_05632 [Schizosaccharomyces japonicus yFS275]